MWYEIDFRRYAVLLLLTRRRKLKTIAYLNALIAPIANIHYIWKQVRLSNIYKIVHTGQRCYLRKALNDRLDPDLRRIYTTQGDSYPRKYIYTRAENKPVFLGKMFIYQNEEYINTGVDFIVYAPVSIINTRLYELMVEIDFYKLESKRYQIKAIYE